MLQFCKFVRFHLFFSKFIIEMWRANDEDYADRRNIGLRVLYIIRICPQTIAVT